MIRIMMADVRGSTNITVAGALSDESVETLQSCCIEALSEGKPVRLHLRDVTAIDERGRTMLQHLYTAGLDLTAKGIYSSYIVDEIQSEGLKRQRWAR